MITTGRDEWFRWINGLRRLSPWIWVKVVLFASAAAAVIAVPTRLVSNSWFSRMTPVRPQDYMFLLASSILIGLMLALRPARAGAARSAGDTPSPGGAVAAETRAAGGGIATALAVGCPVCNKLVVALIGTGGALGVFAPLQPVIAVAAVGFLAAGVRAQLAALTAPSCDLVPQPRHAVAR